MLKEKDFWVGVAVGILLYYLYSNHMKKGPAGS
jgi:hypothetical protein